MIKRNGRRTLLVAGVTLVLMAATATEAAADPNQKPAPTPGSSRTAGPVPGGFADWSALYAFQDKLNAAASRILAAGGAGNAGIVAAPDNRELRVYWKGEVPLQVRRIAPELGAPVRFLPAAYTQRELVAEAQRLATEPGVIEVAPRVDGGGLEVTVAVTARAASPAGQADLRSAVSVPLTITTGSQPQAAVGRQADQPWYYGGARYSTSIGSCTSGFGLSVRVNPPLDPFNNDPPGLASMSAGHCGDLGGAVNVSGRGVGGFISKDTCRDTAMIHYFGGTNFYVYTGAWNAGSAVWVSDAAPDFVGNFVNTGGATSGEHQNIPVQAVNVFISVGGIPCATVGPLTRAGVDIAACVVAGGDSGGPVYAYTGDPWTYGAQPRGTITAGNLGAVTCSPAWPSGAAVSGGNTVWYAPLLRPAGDPQIGSLQFHNVRILTSGTAWNCYYAPQPNC